MIQKTLYEEATGQIYATVSLSEASDQYADPGFAWISGSYDTETQYIVDEAPVSRPAMSGSYSVTGPSLTATGLPEGAKVYMGVSPVYTVTSSGEYGITVAETLMLRISLFPYRDMYIQLNV